ncbi:MAG: aldehyde dehydrogenase family protein [Candidatus Competibacter sp.]
MLSAYSVISSKAYKNGMPTLVSSPIDGEIIGEYIPFLESLNLSEDFFRSKNLWMLTDIKKRKEALRKFVKKLEDNSEDIARLIHLEIGKPLIEAKTEVDESIGLVSFLLKNGEKILRRRVRTPDPFWSTKKNYVDYVPLGIIGVIKPWNYPLSNSLWSIVPALLAGNIVIYKPSEHSCLVGFKIYELLRDCIAQDGVINIIIGDEYAGRIITKNNQINMISFTGSTETAKKILSDSNGIIRRYQFETGGSDFAIILDDLSSISDVVIDGLVWGVVNNNGQVCTSIENILIPDKLYPIVVEKLVQKMSLLQKNKDFGPIQNPQQLNYVLKILEKQIMLGGKFLCGGTVEGNYLSPTVIEFSNKVNITEVISDEIFCSAVRIFNYSSIDQVVGIINSGPYGLGCSIWTADPAQEEIGILCQKLDVGIIWVNDVNLAFPELPWSGRKKSGIGSNLGFESLLDYTAPKAISIDIEPITDKKDWWFPYD